MLHNLICSTLFHIAPTQPMKKTGLATHLLPELEPWIERIV